MSWVDVRLCLSLTLCGACVGLVENENTTHNLFVFPRARLGASVCREILTLRPSLEICFFETTQLWVPAQLGTSDNENNDGGIIVGGTGDCLLEGYVREIL